MGGRGGRSKGCLTCKKRHLKCDEVRPVCLRCRQSGHQCEGYVQQAFIDENIRFVPSPAGDVPSRYCENHNLLHGSPSLAPMRDDICIVHLKNSLFVTDPVDKIAPWLGFRAVEGTLNLSLQCLKSLAKAHFGQTQNAVSVLREGSQLYVGSLRRLNERLGDPAHRSDDDNLMAVWILAAYELLVLSTSTGWAEHALGLGRMIEIRGPAMFAHGLAHDIFANSRFLIILASLSVSKRTFLSQLAWKTIPWCTHSQSKCHMHSLLDILADLPGLKEEFNHESDSFNLEEKSLTIYSNLLHWRRAWDRVPEGVITTALGKDSIPLEFAAFGPALNFTSLMAANCVCIYDATLIQTVELLSLSLSRQQNCGLPATKVSHYNQALSVSNAAAIEICRSVAFQISGTTSMSGQFLVLFPLRMAWKALGGSLSIEGQWIEQVLAGFQKQGQFWSVQKQITVQQHQTVQD